MEILEFIKLWNSYIPSSYRKEFYDNVIRLKTHYLDLGIREGMDLARIIPEYREEK